MTSPSTRSSFALRASRIAGAKLAALEQPGQWAVVKVIKDVDQRETAAILRKVG
ncbi:MAG: hypothetical protein Q7J25_12510 [Vicinamibacterales bacterium]|nr:hypothetical protein [Vicinamibacterales bacterium]